jgi:hypothetical protein
MSNIDNALRGPAAGILAVLTLASLGLTACGGSSGKTSQATDAAARSATSSTASTATSPTTGSSTNSSTAGGSTTGSTTTGSTTTAGPPQGSGGQASGAGGFTAIRECMQKNGISLPKPATGSGGPRGGGSFLGLGSLPKGVTRAQYQAALRKCVGGRFPGGRPGVNRGANSPVLRQAFVKFAACLRQNGVNIPAPNTSGKGPIFGTKGIKTNSPQFRAATKKCRAVLTDALRHGTNAAGGAGAPAAGGQPATGGSSNSG